MFHSENISLPISDGEEGPRDYEITTEEMMDASHILKTGKSPGLDNITYEMINCALQYYPQTVPIHKKGSLDDPTNYRGIALVSCLSKFYYSIINKRALKYATENGIIAENQLGFLPGNRTSDAHLILHNLINKYCHKNQDKVCGCFVDISKAFDCIPRQNLFQKLLDNGITGKVFDSIRNLYNGDKTFIKINDKISQGNEVGKGVRQGCIMSPLLFNIFMADLPEKLSKKDSVSLEDKQKVNCLIWADDILLLTETETGMNHMLKDLDVYCKTNGLTINFDKTKCMIFNKTGRLLRRNFIHGNSKIETVRSYKYLGLVFTPSGEIKSSLEDLRSRALKAYMSLNIN